jgi:hypothetical protein
MNRPLDDNEARPPMAYGERHAWGYLTTAIAVPIVYAAITFGRLGSTPADQIDFQVPLLLTVAASILLNVFLAPAPRRGRDRRDERDTAIGRRATTAAYRTLIAGALAALALAMLEAAPFWIANTLYLAFVLSAVAESIAKIVGYRRGW